MASFINSAPSTSGVSSSSLASTVREDSMGMSRFISNIMDAMTPPSSFTATPSSTLNDWTQPIIAASSSPSQNPIGTAHREYNNSNNNHSQQRDDSSSSPGTSSSISITCFRCEERAPTTRCLECNDLFCYDCCHSITSDCQLRDHTLLPMQQISPIGVKPSSSVNDKEFQCDMHPEPIKYYCESCTQLICQECILWMHKDHVCVPIRGASDTCRVRMLRALENGRTGTRAVKQAIDRAVAYSKSYEKESVDVSMKIRRTIRYFVQALETREKDLLDKVERIKQFKLNELTDQMNALRGILAGLAHTNETLVKCLDLEGIDLFVAKEKGVNQMQYYATMFKNIQLSDDHIIFMPPNLDFSEQIKIQGDVVLSPVNSSQLIQTMNHPSTSSALANNLAGLPEYSGQMNSRISNLYDIASNIGNLSLESYPPRGFGQAILGNNHSITVKYSRSPNSGIPLLSFGPEGQGNGEVSRPWGLCVTKEGNILVADRRNNRIQIFSNAGVFQSAFGCKGQGPGEFDLPAGITTDQSGRIIVIDKDNHRVQIFTSTGEYLFMFGSYGKDCGQFQYPWDVAVNTLGSILVTDTRNHRIQLFTSRGTFITKFVFEGANPTRLLKGPTTPRGICFTTNGNILISDFENHRLIMVDAAMNRVISVVGREGSGINELNRPSGIVTDDEGRIIVADSKNHRVVIFSADLRFHWSVNVRSPGLDDKDRPSDVALTPEGHIVVLFETLPDTGRETISKEKEYIKMY